MYFETVFFFNFRIMGTVKQAVKTAREVTLNLQVIHQGKTGFQKVPHHCGTIKQFHQMKNLTSYSILKRMNLLAFKKNY